MSEIVGIWKFAMEVVGFDGSGCGNWNVEKLIPYVKFDFEDIELVKPGYLELCQTSYLWLFLTIIKGFHLFTIFAKSSMLDICQGS